MPRWMTLFLLMLPVFCSEPVEPTLNNCPAGVSVDSIKETLAKKKLVKKINYNINGDILSTTMQSYNIINSSVYKFLSKYAHYRIDRMMFFLCILIKKDLLLSKHHFLIKYYI